jgi:hypothetical protein
MAGTFNDQTSLRVALYVLLANDGELFNRIMEAEVLASEWLGTSWTPAYVSPNSFSLPVDLTDAYLPGRAVRLHLATGHVVAYVASAGFSPETGLTTVALDRQCLDASLDEARLGVLSPGGAAPADLATRAWTLAQPRRVAALLADAQAPASNDADLGAVRLGSGGAWAWGHFLVDRQGAAWRLGLEAMPSTGQAASMEVNLAYQVFAAEAVARPVKARWRAGQVYNLGDRIMPRLPNGRYYEMTAGSGGWSDDLCTGGAPLSGGDTGGYPKANAFDDNAGAPGWVSSQQGASVSGAAWIGYQFATAQNVRRITIRSTNDARHYVSSAKVQCADSAGGPWTDVTTISIASTSEGYLQTFDLPDGGSHACWRLLAQANTTQYGWYVYEIEMFKPLTTTGTSGAAEPAWPTTIGATVADGSVIWTCDGPGMIALGEYNLTPPAAAHDRFDIDSASLQIPAGAVAAGDRVHFGLWRSGGDTHAGDLIVNELWVAPVEV